MKTLRSVRAVRRHLNRLRRRKAVIGLISTMGALHDGHLALVRKARKECDTVVVSLFINPSQFGPKEDYARYPRDASGDARKLKSAGADLLYMPDVRAVYPKGFRTWVTVREISDRWEGSSRPGHFTGVATVVLKLLNIVGPDRAYFGLKDFQQTVVIRRMAEDLNVDVKIIRHPTVREPDGLAMSSRNRYLAADERRAAAVLWKALKAGQKAVHSGMRSASAVRSVIRRELSREPKIRMDYIAVADSETMEPVNRIDRRVVLALAVRLGKTRLIDNITAAAR